MSNMQCESPSSILDMFDNISYANLAYSNRESYKKATPFQHIVLDDFLPKKIAEDLAFEYPKPSQDSSFKFHNHQNASRHFLEDAKYFQPKLRLFSAAISSRSFLLFLETLTGIKSLLPDPYFMGGGAMMTGSGGFLNVHVDFNWHQKLQAWRRCNVLFYLTKDWKEEYGGGLELWSENGDQKVKEVLPMFNRAVIFSTTATSYHGQPSKVVAPTGVYRNVFSAFYYATKKNELIDNSPHFTKYNNEDERKKDTPRFDTSPYSEKIMDDYLSHVKK
jgi:Rps23 Pro-64 3,4-dihydroxylase Tpa1-like proline 4-hydroxylase